MALSLRCPQSQRRNAVQRRDAARARRGRKLTFKNARKMSQQGIGAVVLLLTMSVFLGFNGLWMVVKPGSYLRAYLMFARIANPSLRAEGRKSQRWQFLTRILGLFVIAFAVSFLYALVTVRN